jgi:hypothetical protein
MLRYSLVTSSVIFSPLLRAAESQPAEHGKEYCAELHGIFKKSMGAKHQVGIGLSYRPARIHRLAELMP